MALLAVAARRTASWHRPLTIFTLAMALLAVVAGLGVAMDHRVLGGAPIWLKPFKFAVSLALYAATIAWIIDQLPNPRRWVRTAAVVLVAASTVEIAVIVLQVVRGTYSHFNVTTPLDTALWGVMAGFVVVLWLATAAIAVFAARRSLPDRASTLAIRYGLVIALVGAALGFLMTTPTPAQLDALAEGASTLVGAHSVGVPDGGPGLAVTGWSTTGGDLRVSHFVGLHGLQAIPLLGWLLGRSRWGLDPVTRARLVTVGAAGYLGLVLLLLAQALRGQPLLAPDGLAVAALAILGR